METKNTGMSVLQYCYDHSIGAVNVAKRPDRNPAILADCAIAQRFP
jgi:hypothetical protein